MNQDERKTAVRRMMLLIAAAAVIIGLYGFRLIFLQLVNGDSFTAQATNTTDYKFTVTAARGDIVDSKGERIASSTTGYSVVLNKLLMGDEDLDTMLQKIVGLLGKNGESWNDSLLIGQPDAAGHYEFTAASDNATEQKALAAMKDNLGLQQYATADDVMEKLVEDYDLADFSLYWQRVLSGIHYEMQLQAFSNVNNFVMAENVSEATVATIKENSLSLPGVEIVETSTRSYEQGTVLPHVLGRVGKITAEKWKVTDENGQVTYPLKEKGYNMNDIIGISGLESAYEDELRGKDGVETIPQLGRRHCEHGPHHRAGAGSYGPAHHRQRVPEGRRSGAGEECGMDQKHLRGQQTGQRGRGGRHRRKDRRRAGGVQLPQL